LDSLGLMAGQIAHDFANHLSVMIGHLSLAQLTEGGLPAEAARHLDEVERATQSARALTQQLLAFAHVGNPDKTRCALPDLIRESVSYALQNAPQVATDFAVPDDLWPVDVDVVQLSRVFHNLALNSVQAMHAKGGALRVIARNLPCGTNSAQHLAGRSSVHLSFIDTGCGIRPENLVRIFDPFFTSKNKGMGLGLTTAYAVIRKHNGVIFAESTVGVGTTFHMYLPAEPSAVNTPVPGSGE
jgi:two-component system cell cycle sensor histidine kinase/response regulator CckA